MDISRTDPSLVDAILDWHGTWLAVRIALTSAYLLGGLTKLLDFRAAVAEQQHFGLNPGWLWASLAISVELGGSALVISGHLVWLGAGALGVLTAIATVAANDFWTMQGQERFAAANTFLEHIGLIAGFVMVALIAANSTSNEAALMQNRSYQFNVRAHIMRLIPIAIPNCSGARVAVRAPGV